MAINKARDYSEVTVKRLFGLSNNKCANPDCGKELILSDGTVIAEICHIEDANQGGRYNPDMTDDERRAFENLILLCRNCHKITDNVNIYSVSVLQQMKSNHELNSQISNFVPTDEQVNKIMASFAYDLDYVEKIDWGILETIVRYVLDKTPKTNYTDDEIRSDEKFLHTREKAQVNFPPEQRKRFAEIFKNTTAKKQVIDNYLSNLYDEDPVKVDDLNEFIVSNYCDVRGVSVPNVKVEDIKYIEILAKRLIPEVKQNSPEYLATAKAMIINSFEYCHIGEKTVQEQNKTPSLFD